MCLRSMSPNEVRWVAHMSVLYNSRISSSSKGTKNTVGNRLSTDPPQWFCDSRVCCSVFEGVGIWGWGYFLAHSTWPLDLTIEMFNKTGTSLPTLALIVESAILFNWTSPFVI